MNNPTTRRTAIATLGIGAAGLATTAAMLPRAALAAISSGAGVVAGGSLDGPNGPIQFSAFGSRLQLDDQEDLVFQGALAWYDPTGMEGEPLTIGLVAVASYGPGDIETARIMTGTASVNGEGAYPFALRIVDAGEIGSAADTIHLVVGNAASDLSGTPIPADAETGFNYDVEGELTSGNVQIVTF